MANPDLKIVTEPHNPYLLETFRAFLAESHDGNLSAQMTLGHLMHGQLTVLGEIAKSLERLVEMLDPVTVSQFISMIDAQREKREAAAKTRDKEEISRALFGKSNTELVS